MEQRMKARAKAVSAEKAAELLRNGKESLSEEELNALAAAIPPGPAAGVTSAAAFCRFYASVKPAKLMPGQSGTMIVTAVLSGQAVIPAPATLERIGAAQCGVVTLGAAACRPAQPGRLAPAYLGRPVYDNYAVIEIPITMAADAELGKKQAVQVDLRFDIHDGASAQLIGKFIDRAVAEVEVGRALDPAVQGGMPTNVGTGSTDTIGSAPVPAAAPSATERAEPARVITGEAALPAKEPAAVTPRAADTEHEPLAAPDEGIGLMPILVAGGTVLLLILLLVARRR